MLDDIYNKIIINLKQFDFSYMKKILRITESDIKNVVRKVLNESLGNGYSEMDAALSRLGDVRVSPFYSDESTVTVSANGYVNVRDIVKVMSQFGYGYYDIGSNGDRQMVTFKRNDWTPGNNGLNEQLLAGGEDDHGYEGLEPDPDEKRRQMDSDWNSLEKHGYHDGEMFDRNKNIGDNGLGGYYSLASQGYNNIRNRDNTTKERMFAQQNGSSINQSLDNARNYWAADMDTVNGPDGDLESDGNTPIFGNEPGGTRNGSPWTRNPYNWGKYNVGVPLDEVVSRVVRRYVNESEQTETDWQWKKEARAFMQGLRSGNFEVSDDTVFVQIWKRATASNDPRYVYFRKGDNRLHDDHFYMQDSPRLSRKTITTINQRLGWTEEM